MAKNIDIKEMSFQERMTKAGQEVKDILFKYEIEVISWLKIMPNGITPTMKWVDKRDQEYFKEKKEV